VVPFGTKSNQKSCSLRLNAIAGAARLMALYRVHFVDHGGNVYSTHEIEHIAARYAQRLVQRPSPRELRQHCEHRHRQHQVAGDAAKEALQHQIDMRRPLQHPHHEPISPARAPQTVIVGSWVLVGSKMGPPDPFSNITRSSMINVSQGFPFVQFLLGNRRSSGKH